MGSFAMMGALAGGAKGLNEGSKAAEAAKQNKLDQAREERLATLKHERLVSRETTAQTHETTAATTAFDRANETTDVKNKFTTSERTAKQEFEASESALDRASTEGIQSSKAEAADKGKTERKWKYSRTPDTETIVDGEIVVAKGATTATNPYDHKTYQQKGDIWVLDGAEEKPYKFPTPEKKAQSEAALMKNPTPKNLSFYMQAFYYVPIDALGASDRYGEK